MRVKNNSDVDKAKNTSFICSDCSSLFGRCVLSYLYVFRDFLWIWKATEFWEVNIFNSLDTCFIMLIYIAEQNVGYQWHYLFLFTHNSGYGCVHVLYIHTYNTEHTHIHETHTHPSNTSVVTTREKWAYVALGGELFVWLLRWGIERI